jgi:phosphatidylserine/phosphatidylglycerophosphate/cardiolipin synthase-like enzyme
VAAIETFTLSDGGQSAEDVARRVAAFVAAARHTLELALYDVRLPGSPGETVAAALREVAGRGVRVRLIHNVETDRPPQLHPPPQTRPDVLADLPIDARAVPGIPDLMHHKYVVRDEAAVWTGSANWTADSWTRQENVVAVVESQSIGSAYLANFEELWRHQDVERSGRQEPELVDAGGIPTRAWFTPGQGQDLSQAIATAIGRARRRVRIASPVITSGPILGTLAEIGAEGGVDLAGVVDEPQIDTVFQQWRENGQSAWKIPLLARALTRIQFSGKPSIPWTPDSVHNFMHAKVTVADDVVFIGSFNLSRSGEMNAENVLEIRDSSLADRMAAFVDEVRRRYPPTSIPEHARATISAGSSATSAIS